MIYWKYNVQSSVEMKAQKYSETDVAKKNTI